MQTITPTKTRLTTLQKIIEQHGFDPDDPKVLGLVRSVQEENLRDTDAPVTGSSLNINHERNAIYEGLINHSFSAIDISEVEFKNEGAGLRKADILLSNQRMQDVFGQSIGLLSDEQIVRQLKLTFGDAPEKIETGLKEIAKNKYLKQRKAIEKDGMTRYFDAIIRLIEVNSKAFIIRIFDDITEKVEQDQIITEQISTLTDRQAELEKYIESNLQLENFAYIASHDLKAPLRTVLSFSQLIKRSSYDLLPTKDQNFLDIVIQSTNNMMLLIEDLLTFSRVNTKKVQLENIILEDLIETVTIDLTSEVNQKKATLNWHTNNVIFKADKVKMIQLFENLLRNAIKFTRKDIDPIVDIRLTESKSHYKFSISDNGIGISEDHLKKVFGIFEKLHSKDIFEGTGLGLSICSKIVAQHNGEIWVESQIDKGSTFYFTISKRI